MVAVAADSFPIGSPADELGREIDEIHHGVGITQAFSIAATEVTQVQWATVMGDDPSWFADCDSCPVERLSWLEATEFCNAASLLDGLSPTYSADSTGTIIDRATSRS
ncbi:MAG: hypothetical protein CME06_03415 [Gemmatimonadetes bacterium]|nr:hypothetical protein [Gemmatimonadota bacterium]